MSRNAKSDMIWAIESGRDVVHRSDIERVESKKELEESGLAHV
jgi:hypothetical protein